ncbi:type 1 glutamine amidotransferase domain-containing protein [Microbulbifer flavimaris]|uniref:Type 1 glutamine amidotransferase domain-containing protein n=1 Tax=Microbulbifer flavimaris TaxID=1781068 RepID=A0ABX4I0K1_9GAMM|nr:MULTISPECIES: type 1 glutamine amidotransferase domain-containing protein [Microbulbifer]KUJ83486.1 hypothetical protein AVO43_06390 [Microbulbifer sp. ZGT114]PCO05646.1 type 1 glutamine amidotransferase domain-containing protein [Microbulbifer flavimaris]
MANHRVLFVLTGHQELGDTGEKTGFHLSEAAYPWRVLREAGFRVDFATPEGGPAPVDPGSEDLEDHTNKAFLSDPGVADQIKATPAVGSLDLTKYSALYFPGGHGTMWDLPDSSAVQDAVREMAEAGKVVGAVCHGPAAFVNVKLSDGSWFVDGKRLSTFTDEEEKAVEKADIVPFMLASKLQARGAIHEKADNFAKSVTVDGNLVTGQNPASAQGVGEAIRDRILAQASAAD